MSSTPRGAESAPRFGMHTVTSAVATIAALTVALPVLALDATSTTDTTSTSGDLCSMSVPIAPRSGSSLSGNAVFTEVVGGVRVVIDVAGASPGKHGAHVHEIGDCSAADAMSAGEHFAPEDHPHGLPPTPRRHLGDFGNIEVGEDGTGHLEIFVPRANLRPRDERSFFDRAIVIHANVDTGAQPSGNAGARIGCGEISTERERADHSRTASMASTMRGAIVTTSSGGSF